MNKTRIENRIDNAVNAFFETGPDRSHFALTFTGPANALVADERTFGEVAGQWTGVVREILLFGPGTFFLYLTIIAAANLYPDISLSFRGLFWIAAFSFMAYAGSGNLRKVNNLAVPVTVMLLAALVASVLSIRHADLFSSSAIYVFPFVLIAAKLVQVWISDEK